MLRGRKAMVKGVFQRVESNDPVFNFDPRIQIVRDIEMRKIPQRSLNRLCDISDWRIGESLSAKMSELKEGCYIHRKSWEYALCIVGLEHLGAVQPGSRGLAVGAGYERPIFYFANKIKEMVATDLYDNPAGEGTPEMLNNPCAFAPFPYRERHLMVRRMDGTHLEFQDATFDFVFSLSSIEHFGSRSNSQKSVQEMFRVLIPGGIVCIATELILNRSTHKEYFTLDELTKYIIGSIPWKIIGGDPDYRISRSLVLNPIELDVETNHHVSPHIVMKSGNTLWTSVMLFLQK